MTEQLEEDMLIFATALEAACVQFKQSRGHKHGVGVKEETFTCLLGWEKNSGNRIGDFEFTTRKANNNSDQFNHAYGILKTNNADIKNQFSDEGFKFHYWIWQEGKPYTVYRKEKK